MLLLALRASPPPQLLPGDSPVGLGATCTADTIKPRLHVLQGTEELAAAFLRMRDATGVHACARLAWNAGECTLHAHVPSGVRL